ncbi:Dabb family protein [Leucobacter sp. NPDC077196]|uniref:Dabb family protein n=1 Tax=Leucobacter sp. NPDC077196 TaxID=3154959 RepID=UPI00341958DF
MPVQHTVVFRLIHGSGSPDEEEFLTSAARDLAEIPGVQAFTVHRQVSPKSGLEWQFSMVFADEHAFRAYNDHPTHVEFVRTRWAVEVAEFQEYDYVVYLSPAAH